MSEMVERVARAIVSEFGYVFSAEDLGNVDYSENGDTFDALAMARAAIKAMREPTEAMQAVGRDTEVAHSWGRRPSGGSGEFICDPEGIWEAMIDAALTPPQEPASEQPAASAQTASSLHPSEP